MQSKLTAKLQSLKEPEASPVSPPISYRTRNKKSSQSRIPVRASPEKSAKLETLIPDPAESAAGDAPNTESVTVSAEAVPDGDVLGEPPVDETEPEDPEPEIEALETPLEQNNNVTNACYRTDSYQQLNALINIYSMQSYFDLIIHNFGGLKVDTAYRRGYFGS